MTIEDDYRRFRNRLRRFGYRETLYVTWAYAQYLQIPNFQFPRDLQVDRRFLQLDVPQRWIAEWNVEHLAREIIIHGQEEPERGQSLRNWAALADTINALKNLDEEIYAAHAIQENILLELEVRTAHRQFIWQQQRPTSRWTIRYYKIFNTPAISRICSAATGPTIDEIYLIGMAFMGTFLRSPRTLPRIAIRGAGQDKLDAFLRFSSLPLAQLANRLRQEHALDAEFAYRYSSLRQFPLVHTRYQGRDEIACPVPTLLFWRITSGLYYELKDQPGFFAAFGPSFQSYAGDVLASRINHPEMRVLGEAEYHVGRQRKDTVDYFVTQMDGAALFVECKTMRLTWDSKAGITDLSALRRDILKLAKAVVQLYRTIHDYRQGLYPTLEFRPCRTIYPIVVTLEDWYFFGQTLGRMLAEEVSTLMQAINLPLAWLEEMPYSILSIDEFETASGIINQVGIQAFMDGKLRDPERRRWAYSAYYNDRYRPEIANLPQLFADEYDAMFEELVGVAA